MSEFLSVKKIEVDSSSVAFLVFQGTRAQGSKGRNVSHARALQDNKDIRE